MHQAPLEKVPYVSWGQGAVSPGKAGPGKTRFAWHFGEGYTWFAQKALEMCVSSMSPGTHLPRGPTQRETSALTFANTSSISGPVGPDSNLSGAVLGWKAEKITRTQHPALNGPP